MGWDRRLGMRPASGNGDWSIENVFFKGPVGKRSRGRLS